MPCFHPLDAWQTQEGEIHFYQRGTQGKKKGAKAPNYRRELTLPCGRCIGCRLDRSKQWAIRLMHEARQHERTAFITLTYDDSKLPGAGLPPVSLAPGPLTRSQASATGEDAVDRTCHSGDTRLASSYLVGSTRLTLNYKHVQKFLRSLRKTLKARRGSTTKIRFYMCGEYGEQLARPHYHIALFGEDFREDRYEWRHKQGSTFWRSPLLEKLWPHGNSDIGNLTIESAAYVARYIMKKQTGSKADSHYQRTDPITGERYWLPPEFSVMSRRPGIGQNWFQEFTNDVYPHDYVVYKGRKLKPPRYYDELLKRIDAEQLETIKEARAAGINHADQTPARLAVREDCAKAKLAFTKRNLPK